MPALFFFGSFSVAPAATYRAYGQLINVLRGDMSFVAPGPERPEFAAMLNGQIPFDAVRHSVKPGLIGWAQVRYSCGATAEQSVRKPEYDLYYVKNCTLGPGPRDPGRDDPGGPPGRGGAVSACRARIGARAYRSRRPTLYDLMHRFGLK